MKKFDVIVIGGGAAGLTVAIGCVKSGKKTLLIEKDKTGGECTWSGCIPSKALINLSHKNDRKNTFQKARNISEAIYKHEDPKTLENLGIHFINGKASFIDSHQVCVNDDIYYGNIIVIATGSVPVIPPIEGLDKIDYLTNQNFFLQNKLPQSMVCIGGGFISLELSMALSGLGVKTTILKRTAAALEKEDEIVQDQLLEILKEANVDFVSGIKFVDIKQNGKNYVVKYIKDDKEHSIESETILISAGRKSNFEDLNLDNAKVEYTKNGITVNDYMQTNQSHIYALGDVVASFRFSHVAGAHGETIVRNIIFPLIKKKFRLTSLPWTLYITPEFSRCGMNEKEAKAKNIDYKVYSIDAKHLERAVISDDKYFLLKVITYKGNIIGAYCFGERAGEIVSLFQFMIEHKLPLHKLMKNTFPYPGYMNGIRALGKQAFLDKIFSNPIVKIFKK